MASQLTALALDIWTYCLLRQIWITAKHLPGRLNVGGGLCISTFQQPHRVDAELQHFQTKTSYLTRWLDIPILEPWQQMRSCWIGAKWIVFIHPPIVLIPRILLQMRQDKATGLMIAQTQTFWKC